MVIYIYIYEGHVMVRCSSVCYLTVRFGQLYRCAHKRIVNIMKVYNVFERWCYRRMLRISWTEHVTNEEVFNRANTKPTLFDELLKRRLAFHGHLVRKGGITLDLMIGRLHGTRPRGRPRTTWLKDLTTHANISYKESMTIPRDRKKWRSVGNPRRTQDE